MFVKIINKIRSKIQICVCSEKVVICKYKTVYSLQQQKCLHVRDIVYLTINSTAQMCLVLCVNPIPSSPSLCRVGKHSLHPSQLPSLT